MLMTVTADKSALIELADGFAAMWDLWLIFGVLIVLIVTYKILQKRCKNLSVCHRRKDDLMYNIIFLVVVPIALLVLFSFSNIYASAFNLYLGDAQKLIGFITVLLTYVLCSFNWKNGASNERNIR